MGFGIYIHIPFCQSKCGYCHFVTAPWHEDAALSYCRALVKELEFFPTERVQNEIADSIYFGGGTPSLVPADNIAKILQTCRRLFTVADDCEISLEANPGTLTDEKIAAYREIGVNRLSIGAQSFNDRELAATGRIHRCAEIEESYRLLRKYGFCNLSIDLMLGLPNQTEGSWIKNLEITSSLAIPHISVYMLDVTDDCPLYAMIDRGLLRMPEEDLVSDLYLQTLQYLVGRGYAQYEISNFARPGHSCRHNLKYWMRNAVFGFGVGSHSFDGQSRYANYSNLDDYLRALETGCTPVEWSEFVEVSQALGEALFLGLRLNRGIDMRQLWSIYGGERLMDHENILKEMSDNGLVEWKEKHVRLTPLGMLLSNEVFQHFV